MRTVRVPAFVEVDEVYVSTEKALAVPTLRRAILAKAKRQADKARRDYDALLKFADTITLAL